MLLAYLFINWPVKPEGNCSPKKAPPTVLPSSRCTPRVPVGLNEAREGAGLLTEREGRSRKVATDVGGEEDAHIEKREPVNKKEGVSGSVITCEIGLWR